MNKLILEILPHIEQVVRHSTSDYDERHEIQQELILKCYENEDKIKQGISEGRPIINLLYVYCRSVKIDLTRHKKVRRHEQLNHDIELTEYELKEIDLIKTKSIKELVGKLKGDDRLWAETVIDCDFNVLEIHRRTGIHRSKIDERLKYTYEKWKRLDIYLQQ